MQKITIIFGLAAGLGLAACAGRPAEPLHDIPAAGVVTGSRNGVCNAFRVNDRFVITNNHCTNINGVSLITYRPDGGTSSSSTSYSSPAIGWTDARDLDAPQSMRDDHWYRFFARDKAILHFYSDLPEQPRLIRLARLDTLTWLPTQNPDIQQTNVTMLSRWEPLGTHNAVMPLEHFHCRIYQLRNMTEVVATDCPSDLGRSGSMLGRFDMRGRFHAVALLAGRTPPGGNELGRVFSTVIPFWSRIGIATTVQSLIDPSQQGIAGLEVHERNPAPTP